MGATASAVSSGRLISDATLRAGVEALAKEPAGRRYDSEEAETLLGRGLFDINAFNAMATKLDDHNNSSVHTVALEDMQRLLAVHEVREFFLSSTSSSLTRHHARPTHSLSPPPALSTVCRSSWRAPPIR
jgi:hypothetical protein